MYTIDTVDNGLTCAHARAHTHAGLDLTSWAKSVQTRQELGFETGFEEADVDVMNRDVISHHHDVSDPQATAATTSRER